MYYITYIDVGIEATACAHIADTIRYEYQCCPLMGFGCYVIIGLKERKTQID